MLQGPDHPQTERPAEAEPVRERGQRPHVDSHQGEQQKHLEQDLRHDPSTAERHCLLLSFVCVCVYIYIE